MRRLKVSVFVIIFGALLLSTFSTAPAAPMLVTAGIICLVLAIVTGWRDR